MRKWLFLVLTLVGTAPVAQADEGETLFMQKCMACHTIGGGDRVGPDLAGVTEKQDAAWLERWIREPDRMIAEKDPTALELLKRYNGVPMPNLGVTEPEAKSILSYIAQTSAQRAATQTPAQATEATPIRMGQTPVMALVVFLVLITAVVGVYVMVMRSTRDSVPQIDVPAAYRIRKIFFLTAALILGGLLVMTLTRTPYPDRLATPDRLVYVTAKQFAFLYSQEPIVAESDIGKVVPIDSLEIDKDTLVEFRVTSLDVTHDFAIYNADGSVFAQTQAMPGYVNRLRVRFPDAGTFNVFCLEYCGNLHQAMRSAFVVR